MSNRLICSFFFSKILNYVYCCRKFNKALTSCRIWKTHRSKHGHNATLISSLKLLSINTVLATKREETSTEVTMHGNFTTTNLKKKVNDCIFLSVIHSNTPWENNLWYRILQIFFVKIQHFINKYSMWKKF